MHLTQASSSGLILKAFIHNDSRNLFCKYSFDELVDGDKMPNDVEKKCFFP